MFWKRQKGLIAFALASIATLLIVTSCMRDTVVVRSYCLLYEPVFFSENDSTETIKQILKNNAVWEETCDDDQRNFRR